MNYAAHWERKFTISENITAEVKRRQKRLKKEGKSDDDIKAQVRTFILLFSKNTLMGRLFIVRKKKQLKNILI